MDAPVWFRPRGYHHFDVPVGHAYANAINPEVVASHSWSPLIHFTKEERRYRPLQGKTVKKRRRIMYASHRDACFLSCYAHRLRSKLDEHYRRHGLDETVIAYRALGLGNYDFASRVQTFIRSKPRVTALCFDVSGFFDHLDHAHLKQNLKTILGVSELPADWYSIYRYATQHRYVNLDDLKAVSLFKSRMGGRNSRPLATITEVKQHGIAIHKNTHGHGIPQGTPISADLSNLYMLEFDSVMAAAAEQRGALYQRYSDDVLVVCKPADRDTFRDLVGDTLETHGLTLQSDKTEDRTFFANSSSTFHYLGFDLGYAEARIRNPSLSRQWRTAKRAIRKIEKMGLARLEAGTTDRIFTRKLVHRFTPVGSRNFLHYAQRSAHALDSVSIKRQTKRLRKYVNQEIARLRRTRRPD